MPRVNVDRQADVTPSDTDWYDNVSWLRIGGAGNLVIKGDGGSPVTIAVDAKEYVPFTGGRVMAATTATGITVHQ